MEIQLLAFKSLMIAANPIKGMAPVGQHTPCIGNTRQGITVGNKTNVKSMTMKLHNTDGPHRFMSVHFGMDDDDPMNWMAVPPPLNYIEPFYGNSVFQG